MIASVTGQVSERGLDHVVIEVGGCGLRVAVSLHTLAQVAAVGGTARLHTYLQVREDALTLFGFATEDERTAFELCISVQQVGPKLAMSILSSLEAAELAAAVRAGDHGRLQRIPGVGKKTAERLVLELRDKMDKAGFAAPAPMRSSGSTVAPAVVSALTNLGYRLAEAERAAEAARAEAEGASVEELLKRALRMLAE